MNFAKLLSKAYRYSGGLIISSIVVLLTSCGGGGSSTPPPPPLVQAILFSFPSGSAPANFPNALVSIMDGFSGADVTNASVTMNGAPLIYNGAPSNQEYEGYLSINPGDTVTLVVKVGGTTYTASGTQFTSYPTISTPLSGATWSSGSDNNVMWSGGSPLTNSAYLLGILDSTDSIGGNSYFKQITTGSNFSIPANSITAGSRYVMLGITSSISIPNADADSSFILGGFDYVPVTVTGMPVTSRISGTTNPLTDAVWSGTQFVAVGFYGTILTSPDGKTWTSRTLGSAYHLKGITWSGTQFVAVGAFGIILTSPDGVKWTARTTPTNYISDELYDVVWTGTQFVVTGVGTILTSPDGVTWTTHAVGNAPLYGNAALYHMVWTGAQLIAVGEYGTILTSPDGVTWSTQSANKYGVTLLDIAWSGTQFVVVSDNYSPCCSYSILTSPDGVTWTPHSLPKQATAVTWSGTQFVTVSWAGIIFTSPDGITWTQQASGTTNDLTGITNSGNKIVIVGGQGTIITSP